jgi:hypothetical protein
MSADTTDISDGFVYSFRVENVFSHFQKLPDETQFAIERNITNVIYDSFAIPADEDYLMARLLAQNGLDRGFFWAASQALEKYLKAYLLMHDQGVKELSRGHKLRPLFDAAAALDPSIVNMPLGLHPDMKIDASVVDKVTVFTVNEYVNELSIHGAAANRYNASGVVFNTGHMLALDALVYQLRSKIGVISINESFKRVSADLLNTFYDNNHYFAPKSVAHSMVPSTEFPIKDSLAATWLDYLQKHSHQQTCSISLLWLGQKMKI